MKLPRAFLVILGLGLALRLYQLSPALLERSPNRQAIDAELVRTLYRRGFSQWNMYLFGLPIYHFLVAKSYEVGGGINEVIGRYWSVVFSVLAAYYFYKLVELYTSKREAIWGLFFFYLISPIHIIISRSFLVDELTLALGIAGLYYLIKERWWLSAGLMSLALASKITFGYLLLPAVWLLRKDWRRAAWYCIVTLLPSLWWYSWARSNNLRVDPIGPTGWELGFWFSPKLLVSPQWYSNVFYHTAKWVLTPIGMVAAFWGLTMSLNFKRYGVFYLWLVGAISFLVVFNTGSLNHAYYFLAMVAPMAALAGKAVGQARAIKAWVLMGVAVITLLNVVSDHFLSAYRVYPSHANMPRAAKLVQQIVPVKAQIIVTAYTSGVFDYLVDRPAFELRLAGMTDDMATTELERYQKLGAQYYALYDKQELVGRDRFTAYLNQFPIIAEPQGLNLRIYEL